VDKVAFLKGLQAIPSPNVRRAQLLLFQGKHTLAEEVLLSNRLFWCAVELNIRLFKWERALGIAEQAEDERLVDAVLWYR
jgi:intraflagellar transport protein 80